MSRPICGVRMFMKRQQTLKHLSVPYRTRIYCEFTRVPRYKVKCNPRLGYELYFLTSDTHLPTPSRTTMHFDLNFPVTASGSTSQPKKNKNKQPQQSSQTAFTPAQIKGIEARLDLLEHCLFISPYVKQRLIASQ